MLRDLYQHCKEGLPKKGQEKARSDARKMGEKILETPPNLPPTLVTALQMFVKHYREYEIGMRRKGERGLDLLQPQCSSCVQQQLPFPGRCTNTSPRETEGEDAKLSYPGAFDLFSNYDPGTNQRKPPTLLIDSDALPSLARSMPTKRVRSRQNRTIQRDFRIQYPERSVEDIDVR